MKPGDGRATRFVFLNLDKNHETAGHWVTQGERFPMASQEAYEEAAKRWLRDKSNLSDKTIECANWKVIYKYFRDWVEQAKASKREGPS